MSRNLMVLNGVASFVELSNTDLVYKPVDDSIDFNFIYENDWISILGDMDETEYITSMGWELRDDGR
jgi:predicted Zn-dependent protease